MAKQKATEKLTNSKIKAERDKISLEIRRGKEHVEKLEKDEVVLVNKLKLMNKSIKLKTKEKERLEKAVAKKIEETKEINKEIKSKKDELIDVAKEIETLDKYKEETKDRIDQETLE